MSIKAITALLAAIVFLTACNVSDAKDDEKHEILVLKGAYLGQEPPGMEPAVFAPGIVSREDSIEFSPAFSPDGTEFFFTSRRRHTMENRLMYMKLEAGEWTQPELAPFATYCFEFESSITPDGQRIFFGSRRPLPGFIHLNECADIWVVERTGQDWGEPEYAGPPFNTEQSVCVTTACDGTVYTSGLRRSRLVEGKYTEWESLGSAMGTGYCDSHPFVAPDHSFILFDSSRRPESLGGSDLYISFHRVDGSWTPPQNLGKGINTRGIEMCASVTPDGKYLFYYSSGDIYWVDRAVIDALNPMVLDRAM